MNKLLQRLPDTSREEVRNQAIVLIQQLTANNEEMKKTVVFNEVCCNATCCVGLIFEFRALKFCSTLSEQRVEPTMLVWSLKTV